MRILYGVVGEGMGHAMRSKVVLDHLVKEGHEVEIVASQRAADALAASFAEVHRIHGLHIVYEENRVRIGRTLRSNVLEGNEALPDQIDAYFEVIRDFEPEVVVSDFESWTYLFGQLHGVPVLSIDNMQIINRCSHAEALIEGEWASFQVTRAFIKGKLPFCDHYFVTTFFTPEVRKERTSLHPPILRDVILGARPERGEHLLVYQTAEGHETLADVLAGTGLECRIYGMRRGIEEEVVEGDLRYRPFGEAAFIDDLRTARGVVAGGGFTLMGECVYLHKPMLSVPVGDQFEQVLNARYLENLGYGRRAGTVTAGALASFLEAIPSCEERLASYSQDGNRDLFEALDAHLDRIAAGLRA
jgi:uncharacterized protein (TIGR00661 family)